MADDASSGAQRNSSLARIRDNQRRSRARRKEYLQELEDKYRSCAQQGVEASAEIQSAARRVAEENRRLRILLLKKGFTSEEIDAGLSEGLDEKVQASPAAEALEGLLHSRIACRSTSGVRRDEDAATVDRLRPLAPIARQPVGVVATTAEGVMPPDQQLFRAAEHDGGLPLDLTAVYGDSLDGADDGLAWAQDDQDSIEPLGDYSSCQAAASAIRSMKPSLGYELEVELGCADGQDCSVRNTHVFDLMDRYTPGPGRAG